MKLRTRLIIAFCIIILLPVVLFVGIGSLAMYPQWASMNEKYDLDNDISGLAASSFKIQNVMADSVELRVKEEIEKDPEKFWDEAYLNELNRESRRMNSYLVVRRDYEYYFVGDQTVNLADITEAVHGDRINMYEYAKRTGQMYRCVDLPERDGHVGAVWIFTKTGGIAPEAKNLLLTLGCLILLILLITAGVLVYWIYRSIIRPIGALRCATQNIRDGNLAFSMEITDDEMGELAADLDEMRRRLQASAEEKVRQDELSRQLLSNISHDLKTPLTTIRGYAEGLLEGVASTPEKQQKYIQTIAVKADDMTRLIEELAVYSKIDANSIPYEMEEISVKDFFEDVAYDYRAELEAEGVEFSYADYTSKGATFRVDPEQMRRVMNNLFSNSVKYMDKRHRWIALRVSEDRGRLVVELEDNGCGISEKDLPRIFDRFYRADASRHNSKNGSGIGLAIVKKIVEDHQGGVSVSSKEGTGTVMRVELPLLAKEEKNE